MDPSAAITATAVVVGIGLVIWFTRWLVGLGASEEQAEQLEAQDDADKQAFDDGEAWNAGDGLAGGVRRRLRDEDDSS